MGTTLINESDGSTGSNYSVPFLIDGKEVHPSKNFDVVSPATGKTVHKCGAATSAEVQSAVDAAAKAFKTWRNTTPAARRAIFIKAAEIMERRKEELINYMVDETGCPAGWGEFNIKVSKDILTDVAGRIPVLEGAVPATDDPNLGALVLKEPFGVVLAIAPW